MLGDKIVWRPVKFRVEKSHDRRMPVSALRYKYDVYYVRLVWQKNPLAAGIGNQNRTLITPHYSYLVRN